MQDGYIRWVFLNNIRKYVNFSNTFAILDGYDLTEKVYGNSTIYVADIHSILGGIRMIYIFSGQAKRKRIFKSLSYNSKVVAK